MENVVIKNIVEDVIASVGYDLTEQELFELETFSISQADLIIRVAKYAYNNGYIKGSCQAVGKGMQPKTEAAPVQEIDISFAGDHIFDQPEKVFIPTDYSHSNNGSSQTLCGVDIDHTIEIKKGNFTCPKCREIVNAKQPS